MSLICRRVFTDAAWAPYNSSSGYLDVSRYVVVTVNTVLNVIEFTALPTMYGIVDFGSQVRFRLPGKPIFHILCYVLWLNAHRKFSIVLKSAYVPTYNCIFHFKNPSCDGVASLTYAKSSSSYAETLN